MAGLLRRVLRPVLQKLPRRLRDGLRGRRTLWGVGVRRVGPYRRRLSAAVRAAMERSSPPSFLVLPTHSWHQASFQRPQQLARALGERGHTVIYLERIAVHPWSTVDEGARNRDLAVTEVSPNVHLVRLPETYVRWLVERTHPAHLLGYSAAEQDPWIPSSALHRLVYDVIDHEHVLDPTGDPRWRESHAKWVAFASRVLATSTDIASWLSATRPDVRTIRNGVRTEDWSRPGGWPVPHDLAEARRAPLVVYYHGILGDPWFDWRLWEACCRLRPTWAFVVVGWPRGETREALESRVARIPNCHYLGPKPHGDLPAYLASCDVAAVPFQVSAATHAASVIKIFEYFAAGKPVVASPLREISGYRSVLVAAGPEAFVERIEEATSLARDAAYAAGLREDAERNTWRSRADQLIEALRTGGRDG